MRSFQHESKKLRQEKKKVIKVLELESEMSKFTGCVLSLIMLALLLHPPPGLAVVCVRCIK